MDPFQQLPEIRYVLEIDDTENQLQLSCLLWELLGDTVASIITTTNTLIIIGNIYIMINCWTLLLELYIYPLNLPPPNTNHEVDTVFVFLHFTHENLRQRELKQTANNPTTPKGSEF